LKTKNGKPVVDSIDPKHQRIQQAYQQGQFAFERGDYRQAVEQLTQASALSEKGSRLGGEIQVWLVTAYEAAGQRDAALSLCRLLTQHAHLETRKQSRRLLAILEAPQLRRPSEWLTQIPDLSNVEDVDLKARKGSGSATIARRSKQVEAEPLDLSQVETHDNQFIWVALVATLIILGGLWWWGT
jgi:hypothetical protein